MARKRPRYTFVDYEPKEKFDFGKWLEKVESGEIFQSLDQDVLYRLTH